MFPAGTTAKGGSAAVVTVSNESVFHVDDLDQNYTAAVRYNLDGTLDGRVNAIYSQRNASTDWIIPNNQSQSDDYEWRFTNRTGFAPTFVTHPEDVWNDLNGGKEVRIQDFLTAFQSRLTQFDIQIRINGGAVIDTGAITLDIENLGF